MSVSFEGLYDLTSGTVQLKDGVVMIGDHLSKHGMVRIVRMHLDFICLDDFAGITKVLAALQLNLAKERLVVRTL